MLQFLLLVLKFRTYLLFAIVRKTWFSVVNGVFLLVCVELDSSSALDSFFLEFARSFGGARD